MKHPFALLCLCGLVALYGSDLKAGQAVPSHKQPGRRLAPPGAPLSAEEILRRALEARGGEAAAACIQSFHCQGTVDFAWGGRAAYESLTARPSQERTIIDFGGGSRYEFVCNGQMAWESQPGSAPAVKDGEQLRESRDSAAFFAWYDDPGACRSVTYLGQTSFDGTPCYELKLTTQSGLEQTHYYNVSNYLFVGMVTRVTLETGPAWCRTSFLEYRKFAGFQFPTRTRVQMEESEWAIRINSVQVNCVDGSAFTPPASLTAAQTPAPAAPSPAGLSDAEIKTMLQDGIDHDKLGVGLVVGRLDAQSRRVVSCGKMDNGTSPEVNGDTLFEIGSITKVFTRLLLHDMVKRGEMNLDDPVQKYLPASVRMPTRNGQQITLWDLTTHTSGLPREMDGPQTVERLYAFLASHKLRRAPGEQFEYSNVGMELLGHVIALKAGRDYEALVRERICRPLQMESTVITLTPELQARRAIGHAPAHRSAAYIGLQALPGAGALFSTANDMLQFAAATLDLTPGSLTPLLKKVNVGHNGGTFGFSSALSLDFKQRRALVVLSNCRNDDLVNHFQPLLSNQSPKPPGTAPMSAEVCDRYVGQYYAREDRLRTFRRQGDRLLFQELGQPSCEVFALSETNFCNPWFGCWITFVRDDCTGRARELILGDVAHPAWRGVRIPGQVLEPAACPLTEADCPLRPDSDLQGVWQGTLRLWYWPFVAYHLKIRVAEPSAGSFRADADSLDQDVKGEPLCVIYQPPTVEVGLLSADGWFQGKINPAHTKVTGHWKQSGHSVRVTFRRMQPPENPKAEGRDPKEGRKPKRETRI